MLTVISPAKKLDYSSPVSSATHTQPALLEHSQELLTGLKALSPKDVCALMGLSDKLGALNYERFQEWQTPFTTENTKHALLLPRPAESWEVQRHLLSKCRHPPRQTG